MAAVDVTARDAPPVHSTEVDDLFDYGVPDDIFKDVDSNMDAPARPAKVAVNDRQPPQGGNLGLDEEIKVTRKRAPVPKLDEERLLSHNGISKLRRMGREKLKFKGKGHEYSDIARLLNMYQLWLDDLYPRAKFADGLAIIEKLGHTKRMQMMRKEWINESKPRETVYEEFVAPSADDGKSKEGKTEKSSHHESGGGDGHDNRQEASAGIEHGGDSLFVSDDDEDVDMPESGDPPVDDLDALLAEDEANTKAQQETADTARKEDFNDEMEAMAEFDDMW